MISMALPYVDGNGRLTKAGFDALQGLAAFEGRIAALEVKLTAAAAVADATGGATVDAEARAELVAVKAALG